MDRDELHLLAWQLDLRGTQAVTALEPRLAAVAHEARMAGVRLVAAAVLADRNAPAVARIRAFGLVASALDHEPPRQLIAA
jgi:hypothetical protein